MEGSAKVRPSVLCDTKTEQYDVNSLHSTLVTLLMLIRLSGRAFFSLSKALAGLEIALTLDDTLLSSHDYNKDRVIDELKLAYRHVEKAGLGMSLLSLSKLIAGLGLGESQVRIRELVHEVHERINDELLSVHLLQIPESKKGLYGKPNLFGEDVPNKLPTAIYDIEEAGKCLALSRSTACVFHLMRVMELGLQEFAKKLSITIDQNKQWQVILDQVNNAIGHRPNQTPQEKATRSLYAESTSHLYAVKVAWRNEVMHPRAVYTEEEAQDIFNNVKTFIQQLVAKILI